MTMIIGDYMAYQKLVKKLKSIRRICNESLKYKGNEISFYPEKKEAIYRQRITTIKQLTAIKEITMEEKK